MTMKAATLHGFDEELKKEKFVVYEDVPDPKIIKATDVIVKIGGAGVCRTDLHIIEGVWRDFVDLDFPHIMRHENAGWVEEVGSGVESVNVLTPFNSLNPESMDPQCYGFSLASG